MGPESPGRALRVAGTAAAATAVARNSRRFKIMSRLLLVGDEKWARPRQHTIVLLQTDVVEVPPADAFIIGELEIDVRFAGSSCVDYFAVLNYLYFLDGLGRVRFHFNGLGFGKLELVAH